MPEHHITTGAPPKETSEILGNLLTSLTEAIAGIAASEKKDWALSFGYLLQRVRGGNFLATLKKEWDGYREKGRIKPDYQFTEQHLSCLTELLEFIDKDAPDNLRFTLLKKIFLAAATEKFSDRDSIIPLEYMQISRTLSSGEILILNAAFRIATEELHKQRGSISNDAHPWLKLIAEISGLKTPELVAFHEEKLISKNLISPRTHSDKSGVQLGITYRLTELGWHFCEYIQQYEENKDAPK